LKSKPPQTVGEVRHLLGLLGYYRKYIADFSRRAKPLFELLVQKESSNQKAKKNGKQKKKGSHSQGHVSSSQQVVWTDLHQSRLEELIDVLISPPVIIAESPPHICGFPHLRNFRFLFSVFPHYAKTAI
jgi:hypothetical protein